MRIGIRTEEGPVNFTQLWEIFKEIKSRGRGPRFNHLQMMVELDFFSLDTFSEVLATVREYRSLDDLKLEEPIHYQVPIARPQKILGLGRNYRAHAAEGGVPVPEEPIFFAKMPSSLLPHEGEIVIPPGVGRVDHEIELALVIGRTGKNIPEDDAMDYVSGYTIMNDVTARELQSADFKKSQPWLRSKSFDTFCPIGPYLVPKEEIADPHTLEMRLRVNGEVRQQANTSEMVFKISQVIAYISRHMTLQPSDIIATGTPEGVSPLTPGDTVEAEIEGLGVLRNRVIAG